MQVHTLRCFGATANAGNPALVIEDDQSNPDARQSFAREHNTTCVWIDPPQEDGTAAIVDFYYPHTRSPLCLHATLAAAARLFARPGANPPLTVKTAMHGQPLVLTREGEHLFVRLSPQPAPQPALTPELPARLLGIPTAAIVAAPQVASIGSPKLLVQVRDPATLHALTPDLEAITQWGKENGVNGLYAYAGDADAQVFEGRNFNHLDPRLEDSATGVAAGALTFLLGRGLTVRQGRATGHDCLIRTRMEDGSVLVGGCIETI
ncbi:PhzF family phenazine biosynthesis protein [Massilia sp. CFBP9026]|uniref:PhzF family phenazine biosynthesis protein n=1 Tax=Massilia sp. CFBP9026 TaxID=3096536 RepID=UPI002A6A7465|nr:PhzF family phenazine biosynthesis protein [Massilia sp. CFBP9026]MDY0962659.1 PhzF family phenazine biosynthesis protein [Massilia sp. CFBP9026]